MSRSNQTSTSSNPSQRFLEWGGKKTLLSYWDKEQEKNIEVPIPFTFLLLEELSTITGYSDTEKSGIYSNEVKSTKTEELEVKYFKGGTLDKGLYENIKYKVKSLSGKYTKSLYIAMKIDGKLQIANLKLSGACIGVWIDFCSSTDQKQRMSKAICIAETKVETKGENTYQVPVFQLKETTPETDAQAIELDKQLQAYFKEYFGKVDTNTPTEANTAVDSLKRAFDADEMQSDDLPF
jgi:hypothetical protein